MTLDAAVALPGAQDTLLLRASLLPTPAASVAWRAWRAQVSVEDSHPSVHGLFPLAASNLPVDALGSDAPTLQGLRRRGWAVTERVRARMPSLVEQLTLIGDDARPIRGAAFLVDAGPVPRPITQLDLQVRPDRWEAAVQALLRQGWNIAIIRSRSDAGISMDSADGIRVVLDWAPGFPGGLRRPLEPASGSTGSYASRILIAVIEGLGPMGHLPLTWPVDVTYLAGRMSGADWDELVAGAAAAHIAPVVGAGLRWARDEVSAAVPAAAVDALASGPLDRALGRRFRNYAAGDARPARTRQRLDMRRAARRHGIDIGLGTADASPVSRSWALLRSHVSP